MCLQLTFSKCVRLPPLLSTNWEPGSVFGDLLKKWKFKKHSRSKSRLSPHHLHLALFSPTWVLSLSSPASFVPGVSIMWSWPQSRNSPVQPWTSQKNKWWNTTSWTVFMYQYPVSVTQPPTWCIWADCRRIVRMLSYLRSDHFKYSQESASLLVVCCRQVGDLNYCLRDIYCFTATYNRQVGRGPRP